MMPLPSIARTPCARKNIIFLFRAPVKIKSSGPQALDFRRIDRVLRCAPSSTLGRIRDMAIFIIVGGISALLYLLLNVIFVMKFSMRPALAIVLTLAFLMPPTYLAQRILAFHSSRPHRVAFPRYVATQAIGNLMGILGAELGSSLVIAFPCAAFTAVAAIVALVNYFLLKVWAFTDTGVQDASNVTRAGLPRSKE